MATDPAPDSEEDAASGPPAMAPYAVIVGAVVAEAVPLRVVVLAWM
jgi:hypothetical protein